MIPAAIEQPNQETTTDEEIDPRAKLAKQRAKRLLELQTAARKRDEAKDEAATDAEIERLELCERFEEAIGPRGVSWDMLDATSVGEGFFVIKLGPAIHLARFQEAIGAAEKQGKNEAGAIVTAAHAFVEPNIAHPDPKTTDGLAKIRSAFEARPELRTKLASLLHDLYGGKAKAIGKK